MREFKYKDNIICDSGVVGPTIGIIALTHGNEIAGLDAQEKFISSGFGEKIIRGKVIFLRVNIKAFELDQRFVDVNMNRIGKFLNKTESYEYKRLQELLETLNVCDVVLDIHSVPKNINNLMGICHSKDSLLANKILKTDRLLVDDNFDDEGSLISFVTKRGGIGFGIECGYHEQDDAWKNALDNIISLLRFYEMIDVNYSYQTETCINNIYKFYEEVFPRTQYFSFKKNYNNFDRVKTGETYATDGNIEYKNNTGNDLYLGIIGNKITVGDGIAFLFTKDQ